MNTTTLTEVPATKLQADMVLLDPRTGERYFQLDHKARGGQGDVVWWGWDLIDGRGFCQQRIPARLTVAVTAA